MTLQHRGLLILIFISSENYFKISFEKIWNSEEGLLLLLLQIINII